MPQNLGPCIKIFFPVLLILYSAMRCPAKLQFSEQLVKIQVSCTVLHQLLFQPGIKGPQYDIAMSEARVACMGSPSIATLLLFTVIIREGAWRHSPSHGAVILPIWYGFSAWLCVCATAVKRLANSLVKMCPVSLMCGNGQLAFQSIGGE